MGPGLYEGVLRYRVQHVKYLLSHGIPINQLNETGRGVLYAALTLPDPDKRRKMFNFLLRHGADYHVVDKLAERDVLQWACFLDRTDQVRKLIEFSHGDLDFRRKDTDGRTCLHLAVRRGNSDVVWTLCREMRRLGVSVDMADREGLTPYLQAQREGRGRVASILVQDGGASTLQFDTVTFRTSLEWSEFGRQERKQAEDARAEALLKLNGQGSRVKDARYRRKVTRPPRRLQSMEHRLPVLHSSQEPEIPMLPEAQPTPRLAPMQIKVTVPKVIIEETEDDGKSANMTSSTSSLTSTNLSQSTTSGAAEPSVPLRDIKRPQAEELRDILGVLAEQVSGSYRKSVRAPAPPPPGLGPRRVSTLAVILARARGRAGGATGRGKLQNAVASMLRSRVKEKKKDPLLAAVSLLTKNKSAGKLKMAVTKATLTLPPVGGN